MPKYLGLQIIVILNFTKIDGHTFCGTGYSFLDRLRNFLHRFTRIDPVCSTYELAKQFM